MLSFPRPRRWLVPSLVLTLILIHALVSHRHQHLQHDHPTTHVQIQQGTPLPQSWISSHLLTLQTLTNTTTSSQRQQYLDLPSHSTTPPTYSHLSPLFNCPRRPNRHTKHIRLPSLLLNVSQHLSNTGRNFNPTILALPPWSPNPYLVVSRVATTGLHQESVLCEARICRPPPSNQTASANQTSPPNPPPPYHPTDPLCTPSDLLHLGPSGGLHCVHPPISVNIPPTPAEQCTGSWATFPHIPGFHDPRIFWGGRGEPLIMVNSASRYGCVGLWVVDLRVVHGGLGGVVSGGSGDDGGWGGEGPVVRYPHLTELTRSPRGERGEVEKNWFFFWPMPEEAYVHYDLSLPMWRAAANGKEGQGKWEGGRTFAKVIGAGYTTPNLTDPAEPVCLHQDTQETAQSKKGTWHQTSNALKLVLCRRADIEHGTCASGPGVEVHFAIMHRKFSNEWNLPLRYERFFVVWDAQPPFRMLGISRFPVLLANETASGWKGWENWDEGEDEEEDERGGWEGVEDDHENDLLRMNTTKEGDQRLSKRLVSPATEHNSTKGNSSWNSTGGSQQEGGKRENWAYFTYTPSIAWAWRPAAAFDHKGHSAGVEGKEQQHQERARLHARILEGLSVGYLDDEVILGIGVDDQGQVFARVKAEELLGCMKRCPSS